jgi:hypothetical protein
MQTSCLKGDIFVVDRGLRDLLGFLDDLGMKTEIPVFLKEREAAYC